MSDRQTAREGVNIDWWREGGRRGRKKKWWNEGKRRGEEKGEREGREGIGRLGRGGGVWKRK